MGLTLNLRVQPLLERAGALALANFGRLASRAKPDGTPVTEVDTQCEDLIVRGLSESFPEDAIVGEEGARRTGGGRTWLVDPLDGTHAYLDRLAHWGPLVSLLDGGHPIAGFMLLPALGTRFAVEPGAGFSRDGAPCPPLHGGPQGTLFIPTDAHRAWEIHWPGKTRSLGSIGAHLFLTAAGSGAATLVGASWAPWDVAGGLAALEAVGGRAVTVEGEPLDLERHAGQPFVAGGAPVVEWLGCAGRVARRSAQR